MSCFDCFDINLLFYLYNNSAYTLVIGATVQFKGQVHIVGSHGLSTAHQPLAIDSNVVTFMHTNFGFISFAMLRAHPNQKVFVECCFLRNNVTNSLHRFECNKWLGKSIDDGSLERLLVAELVHGTINEHINNRTSHTRSSSIGRANWNSESMATASTATNRDGKASIEDLQTMLGESVNQIVKFYFADRTKLAINNNTNTITTSNDHIQSQKSQQKTLNSHNGKMTNSLSNSATLSKMGKTKSSGQQPSSRTLIGLLFGEGKFLWIITQIFYVGFKNRRSFRKQNFIWDYVVRVQTEIKITTDNKGSQFVQEFIQLVDSINEKAASYGKDLKFQLFILLSLRLVCFV